MKKITTKQISKAGIVGALYVVLSLATFSFSGGAVQLRLSEALTILPLIFIESVPGLFVGCLITNLITGCALLDVFLGALVTLIAGVLTYIIGRVIKKHWLKVIVGGLFPVLLNALILPAVWYVCYGQLEFLYFVQVGLLTASQSLSIYLLGSLLYYGIIKMNEKSNITNDNLK